MSDEKAIKSMSQVTEAIDTVMDPERMAREITFMDKTIRVRPLPIFWAKRIHSLTAPASDMVAKAASGEAAPAPDKKDEFGDDYNQIVGQALCEAAAVLWDFYGNNEAGKPKMEWKTIEETASLSEINDLLGVQAEVNRSSDFLLRPLRGLVRLCKNAEKQEAEIVEYQKRYGVTVLHQLLASTTTPSAAGTHGDKSSSLP